ncbi:MAG TPA: hypothetical protein VEV17_21390, partial [Bryobacteraceae bacterium]|nr:hypothetical protein [Bryobacteraceae bacterium]
MREDGASFKPTPHESSSPRRGLAWLAVLLFCLTAVSLAFVVRERRQVRELTAGRDQVSATLNQAQSEIQALSTRLDALSAASRVSTPARRPVSSAGHRRAGATKAAAVKPAEDPRWKRLQAEVAEQDKQIAGTREELERTREALQSRLDSARDDLSGSIAKNHEELLALEKHGERNYHEFLLNKSKDFQRVGSISLSLRKVNTRHKSYNVAMIVDDFTLEKKNVNLYEPVLINLSDRPQPLELVVNHISKDQVEGYLSEPKYKKSELAARAGSTVMES